MDGKHLCVLLMLQICKYIHYTQFDWSQNILAKYENISNLLITAKKVPCDISIYFKYMHNINIEFQHKAFEYNTMNKSFHKISLLYILKHSKLWLIFLHHWYFCITNFLQKWTFCSRKYMYMYLQKYDSWNASIICMFVISALVWI
jgi:hypothetical protein